MPYSNELDYDYMGNPVARQNTIPSGRNWRMNAAVAKEAARAASRAAEELEADRRRYLYPGEEARRRKILYGKRPKDWSDEDIYELAYDMMNDVQDYVPESRAYEAYMPSNRKYDDHMVKDFQRKASEIRSGTYRPVDEYGREFTGALDRNMDDLALSRYYDALTPHSIGAPQNPSKAEAFLFGVNPPSAEEHDFLSPRTLAYMVPGVGEYLYGSEVAGQVSRGGMPGFVETAAFGVPIAKAAARRVFRAGKGLLNAQRASDARRAAQGQYERMLRARSLNAPKVRMQNARTGRWDEVNAYPEFVPYEEVRF